MKYFIFFILVLHSYVSFAKEVSISRGERETIHRFLEDLLGQIPKEIVLKAKIKSVALEDFHGHTSMDAPGVIEISNDLLRPEVKHELLGTLVHEMVHLNYYKLKPNEDKWVLEGMALLAEYLFMNEVGGASMAKLSFYPIIESYLRNPGRDLTSFDNSPEAYGSSFLFFLFVYENFYQNDFSERHTSTLKPGLEGIQDALQMGSMFLYTPKEWKDPKVLVPHFYWSIFAQKNSLAMKSVDRFSALIKLAPKILPFTSEGTLEAYSFVSEALPQGCSRIVIKGGAELLIYLTDGSKRIFAEQDTSVETGDLPSLLIINNTTQSVSYSFNCEQNSKI